MIEVFLISNIRSLGKVGDKVFVRRGRARNYLFPNNLAVPVNPYTEKNFEQLRVRAETSNKAAIAYAESVRDKLSGVILVFHENAHEENDMLFGSVSARQIAERLNTEYGLNLSHDNIDLRHPLKHVGEFCIPVLLHDDVVFSVTVNVAAQTQH